MSIRKTATPRSSNGNTGRKCMRPGPVTKNGFFNYLRQYRQNHCGLTAVEVVRQGAKEWNSLSPEEKQKYKMMVKDSYKERSRHRSLRSRSRQHARSCLRPGRLTNNGYLNYLREYRKTCCGMTQQETIRRGARKWISLPEKEKDKYRRTAAKVKHSRRSYRRSSRTRC